MAVIEGRPVLTFTVRLQLTEAEAGALDAIAGYGADSFLEVFYKHMGKAYLEQYEGGLRSLFDSVRCGGASVGGLLEKVREAREVFNGSKKGVYIEDLKRLQELTKPAEEGTK